MEKPGGLRGREREREGEREREREGEREGERCRERERERGRERDYDSLVVYTVYYCTPCQSPLTSALIQPGLTIGHTES